MIEAGHLPELKLPPNPEEEAEVRETMERMREAANAQLAAEIKEIPDESRSDQWKRGGICAMCRRQKYCQKQCRANKRYASLRIYEYIRRRIGIDAMRKRMSDMSLGESGHVYEEE